MKKLTKAELKRRVASLEILEKEKGNPYRQKNIIKFKGLLK